MVIDWSSYNFSSQEMKSISIKSKLYFGSSVYDVDTAIPAWLMLILFGSSVLIVKEIYQSLK